MRGTQFGWLLVVVFCLSGAAVGQAERIIYVDEAAVGADDGSSWPDACIYLQDALAEAAGAVPPVEIRVAQGVYKPDQGAGITPGDGRTTFQLLNGITLKGGYAGAGGAEPDARDVGQYTTVLSGNLADHDDSYPLFPLERSGQVVTGDLTDATAVIDGFTVTGAWWNGMHIEEGSPTIRNCVFERNGNGLDIHSGAPSVTDCRFSENDMHEVYTQDCNCVLARCVFERHGIEHFAVSWTVNCWRGNLKLTDCTFTENRSRCVYVRGKLDLVGCSFVGNSESFWNVVHCSQDLAAFDCVFLNNTGEVVFVGGDAEFVNCRFLGSLGTAVRARGDITKATRCVFSGNSHMGIRGGAAVDSSAMYTELSHCIFTGNSSLAGGAGAVHDSSRISRISHCTFTGNRGRPSAVEFFGDNADRVLTHCIVRDGPDPFAVSPDSAPTMVVTYSNVEGGWAGEGNIDVDPCFVDPGYWDANDPPGDPTDDVWVAGDYHLKSQAGHWDVESESWVLDDATSLCLDAGDPNAPIDAEPFPNGGYANLGAYGGTAEASRSYFGEPLCTTQIAGDINGDCKVNDLDMDILLSHWQMEDIGRANLPPTIRIVSPQDGDEFTRPEPIILHFETSDPDGRVIYASYTLASDSGLTVGEGKRNPGEGWVHEHDWMHICDGVYVLRAEVYDDNGAKTVSPEVRVTLRP